MGFSFFPYFLTLASQTPATKRVLIFTFIVTMIAGIVVDTISLGYWSIIALFFNVMVLVCLFCRERKMIKRMAPFYTTKKINDIEIAEWNPMYPELT
jgi:hypothetical protein